MKPVFISIMLLFGLSACDDAKKAGDDTARELTGSNMVQQKKVVDKKIQQIEQQQADRMKQMDE